MSAVNRLVLKVSGEQAQVEDFVSFLEERVGTEYIIISKSRIRPNDGEETVHRFVDIVPRDLVRWLQR